MKKRAVILFVTVLCALCAGAANYGILVNGKTYFAAEYRGKDANTGTYDEYLAHVNIQKGDYCQLCDVDYEAQWAVDLDTWSVAGFRRDGNRYTASVTGCYDFYIKLKYGEDQLYIGPGSGCGSGEDYATMFKGSVPRECGAVLMQAFYNESYRSDAPGVSEYGDTKWATLLPQAGEIGRYFDYVWLPPSAYGDGAGYHPKQYSNQNSNWGTREELETLIGALHQAGSKVVADVVINHCEGWSSWCDFPEMDFGEYGVFHPDGSYICKGDEVNLNPDAGECYGKATGHDDDGDNWSGARDWAHDDPKVQKMFIAYLKWLRNVMHYDGFRYDKGDGFNNWHHYHYNKEAMPEIAFMECYCGDDKIIEGIEGSKRTLMGLDFQTKWQAFDAIAGWDYSKCKGSGLLGRGYAKYAVTFIESHDWFLRPDNQNEFGGRGNSMKPELKARLLQANAFMLSMPGVPCVFYPHWHKYKEELKPMIEARRLAGVHSESEVKDEYAEQGGYQATIAGKYGWLIVCLGDKANKKGFGSDYKLMASHYSSMMGHNESYEIWVHRTAPVATGLESLPPSPTGTRKVLRDGRLYLIYNGLMYNVQGTRIN